MVKEYYSEFDSTLEKIKKNRISGQKCTKIQIENKWKGLNKNYKNIKDHNGKSGNDRRSWKYLNIMDMFMSERPEVIPPATCSNANRLKINKGNNYKSWHIFNANDFKRMKWYATWF